MLLEENKLLELLRLSSENLFENKEQFRSGAGINPDCFMRLFNYLNPGDDCSNIKFYDTSKCLLCIICYVSFLFQTPKATVSRYIITCSIPRANQRRNARNI